MARTQTRDQHPTCDEEDCTKPATLTLEYGAEGSSGYLDLCDTHSISFLEQHPRRGVELLVAMAKTALR